MSYNKKKLEILFVAFLGILSLFLIGGLFLVKTKGNNKDVVMNEICSSNFSVGKDANGNYCDYIELYNPGTEDIILDGYYLSDDKEVLNKYSLQGMSISSQGYLVVWLDGISNEELGRTGFGISNQGESVYLVKGNEEVIIDYVYVPKLTYNTSYARKEDGVGKWEILQNTVGQSNKGALDLPSQQLNEPVFSVESGFYEDEFYLKLKAGLDEEIYYTLDGSNPTKDSLKYRGKIKITDCSEKENIYAARTDLSATRDYVPDFKVDKATVVRAISYNTSQNTISDVATKVYFVGYDGKEEYKGFPIISLTADPEDLFNYETGIYGTGKTLDEYKEKGGLQNGELLSSFTDAEGRMHHLYEASNAYKEGKEWEREANLVYFNENHEYEFSQNVGIRIAGASTRSVPQKSLNIYARDIYDEEVVIPYSFFDGITATTFKLRHGGNSCMGIKITDAFLESLVEDRDVSIQRSRPCIVFLNGEYWGIYNIRERYNEEYISTYYGIDEENVWIMDGDRPKAGGNAALDAYNYFITMATECDLSYDDVYAMVSELIDVQSFIDYCCINLYTNNTDISFVQNMAAWRSAENDGSEYGDTKWRWMVFDMDYALQSYDVSADPGQWIKNYCLMQEPVFQSFMRNKNFREQFYKTLEEIGRENFNYALVSSELEEWKEIYEEQLLLNHVRFYNEGYGEKELEEDFAFIDNFFAQRFAFIEKGIEEMKAEETVPE